MRWRIFNVAAGLSLALGLATTALWARSYLARDLVVLPFPQTSHHAFEFRVFAGTLSLSRVRMSVPVAGMIQPRWTTTPMNRARRRQNREWAAEANLTAGFGYRRTTHSGQNPLRKSGRYTTQWDHLIVPLWLPLLVTLVLPTLWGCRAVRRAKRMAAGRCGCCGYDLRATPDRCPECGATDIRPGRRITRPMQRTGGDGIL